MNENEQYHLVASIGEIVPNTLNVQPTVARLLTIAVNADYHTCNNQYSTLHMYAA